jgi:hypothetical protein
MFFLLLLRSPAQPAHASEMKTKTVGSGSGSGSGSYWCRAVLSLTAVLSIHCLRTVRFHPNRAMSSAFRSSSFSSSSWLSRTRVVAKSCQVSLSTQGLYQNIRSFPSSSRRYATTGINIRNSLVDDKAKKFICQEEGQSLSWYSCGPTVYEVSVICLFTLH